MPEGERLEKLASYKRSDYLHRACDILLDAGTGPDRVCGYVRNTGRPGEEVHILTLGGSRADDYPRGYEKKRDL